MKISTAKVLKYNFFLLHQFFEPLYLFKYFLKILNLVLLETHGQVGYFFFEKKKSKLKKKADTACKI